VATENGVLRLDKAFYRPDEVAKILECSQRQVYRFFDRGDLDGIRLGRRMGIRISGSSLSTFIESHQNGNHAKIQKKV